jgi:DNA-directed RNA polymerase specialized sigma24 family protein
MLMTTDTLLVYRAARGDREAFERIYDASFACAWAFAGQRTGTRAAAESLARAILAHAFAHLDDYAGDVPFAAWLFGVAKQVATRSRGSRPQRARRTAPYHGVTLHS